jgi:hypothetical protein
MVLFTNSEFARRQNRDGTMDSICRKCYATVRTSCWEADLETAEQMHICDPAVLEYWNNRPFTKKTNESARRAIPFPTK